MVGIDGMTCKANQGYCDAWFDCGTNPEYDRNVDAMMVSTLQRMTNEDQLTPKQYSLGKLFDSPLEFRTQLIWSKRLFQPKQRVALIKFG